jgi:hypothetical protein
MKKRKKKIKREKCKYCEGIFGKSYTIPSTKNIGSCIFCEDTESCIKSNCFICGAVLYSSLHNYIRRGNMCWLCEAKISRAVGPRRKPKKSTKINYEKNAVQKEKNMETFEKDLV